MQATRGRRAALGALLGSTAGLLASSLGLHALVKFPSSRALFIVCAAVAGALVGLTRARAALATAVVLLGLLYLAVAFSPLCNTLAAGAIRRDVVAPADAVIVLGSVLQPDGDLSTSGQNRLLRAIELLRAGLAPRLVITDWGSDPPHLDAAGAVLERLGIGTEVISLGKVDDTHDEALAVARLFSERGFTRGLLVTSPLHTRRAAAAFEQAGVTVISVPAVETRFDVEKLTRPDDRVAAFGDLAHERLGLLVYRWRGWAR